MQLKSTILAGLALRTLRQIVDELEIDADRRGAGAMRTALSRSRKVTVGNLLRCMRKGEIKAVCEYLGLPDHGRRNDLMRRVESLDNCTTKGLDDGSRIKSYKGGWVVVDRRGLFLADPKTATWVISRHGKQMPPAVFPTPGAAYMASTQAQDVAKGRMAGRPHRSLISSAHPRGPH